MSAPSLAVTGLSGGYGEAVVLRSVDLELQQGEIFALLGKNGMGKSTLLKSIMGLLPKMGGRVLFEGRDVTATSAHLLARSGIGYVAQEKALFQDLTVEENIRLCVRARSMQDAVADVGECFPFLLERLQQRAGTLSGGEQKMLLVARSIASGARLLLIDEISEGLQPSMVQRVGAVLTMLCRRRCTTLLVEQNVAFARAVAGRYAVLDRGEIVDRGDTADRAADSRIAHYLHV